MRTAALRDALARPSTVRTLGAILTALIVALLMAFAVNGGRPLPPRRP